MEVLNYVVAAHGAHKWSKIEVGCMPWDIFHSIVKSSVMARVDILLMLFREFRYTWCPIKTLSQ
jgi:hypothetical protein